MFINRLSKLMILILSGLILSFNVVFALPQLQFDDTNITTFDVGTTFIQFEVANPNEADAIFDYQFQEYNGIEWINIEVADILINEVESIILSFTTLSDNQLYRLRGNLAGAIGYNDSEIASHEQTTLLEPEYTIYLRSNHPVGNIYMLDTIDSVTFLNNPIIYSSSVNNSYIIEAPDPDGYTFVHWYDLINDNIYETEIGFLYSFPLGTDELRLEAVYTRDTYTVRFFNQGSEVIPNQTIYHGENANLPNRPIKEDVVFQGWYTDNFTFENRFDFNTPITSDTNLYAKYVDSLSFGENILIYLDTSLLGDWGGTFLGVMLIIFFTIALAFFNAPKMIIISNIISFVFVFTVLGLFPFWIVLVIVIAVIFLGFNLYNRGGNYA